MSISTSRDVITRQEPGPQPTRVTAPATAPPASLFRLRSAQPSRRAVVHLQAAGDPVVPADLAAWFTERSCHFYLFGIRVPTASPLPSRRARATERAFAELDAVSAHLRDTDGIEHLIVSAQGRAAGVAARWCDRRTGGRGRDEVLAARPPAADALILYEPGWTAGARLRLDIGCPVLVVSGAAPRSRYRLRRRAEAVHLGGHVTRLRLPDTGLASPAGLTRTAGGPASRAFFAELGRWLGAYMYGVPVDQLL